MISATRDCVRRLQNSCASSVTIPQSKFDVPRQNCTNQFFVARPLRPLNSLLSTPNLMYRSSQ